MTNSEKALEFIRDGDVVGLGTGRASVNFLQALGVAVRAGLQVRGVATSRSSAGLAQQLGIPLATLEEVDAQIDITVDGADEADDRLNLVKGLGGALVREKIVAAASRRLIILVGPDNLSQKRTAVVGTRGVLPVEVVPFGLPFCMKRLAERGLAPVLRQTGGSQFVTDNGNAILDCRITPLEDPAAFDRELSSLPGVVGTGLFVGMANLVLAQHGDELEILERKPS